MLEQRKHVDFPAMAKHGRAGVGVGFPIKYVKKGSPKKKKQKTRKKTVNPVSDQ